MRDEHREALGRYVVAIEKGARPERADENLVVLLVRSELGDPTARQVLANIGFSGERGRPPAYGPHLELRDRALALEVAIYIADGLAPTYAIDQVAKTRHKSKRDVAAAIDDYSVPRYDCDAGKLLPDYDDLVATLIPAGRRLDELRASVEGLWRSFELIRPKRKAAAKRANRTKK